MARTSLPGQLRRILFFCCFTRCVFVCSLYVKVLKSHVLVEELRMMKRISASVSWKDLLMNDNLNSLTTFSTKSQG